MRQIEEFLDEYRRSRVIIESTVRATLNRTLEFEDKLQKPFYDFSEDEILNIFKSFHTISIVSVQNANLLLKHASIWMIDKHQLINGKRQKYYLNIVCLINRYIIAKNHVSSMMTRELALLFMEMKFLWTNRIFGLLKITIIYLCYMTAESP